MVGEFDKLSQQLRGKRSQVGEARNALESYNRRGQVLQSLMEQKGRGNLPGVHGRLVRGSGKGLLTSERSERDTIKCK